MSRTFEITYSPAQWDKPYGGVHTLAPENIIPPNYTPGPTHDFIVRNQELRSRPKFNYNFIPAPDTGRIVGLVDTATATPFASVQANQIRALFAFTGVAYVLSTLGPPATWATVAGAPPMGGGVAPLVSPRLFQGTIYYTSLSGVNTFSLSSIRVSDLTVTVDNAFESSIKIGSFYLDELDNHLIMAAILQSGTPVVRLPFRVAWSQSNVPTQWDPTVNVNAGFQDFLEVAGNLTGIAMMGRTGYLFRDDGIIEMAPTGRGIAPFDFNHLSTAERGVGNVCPYAVASYGTVAVFIARDNIFIIDPTTNLTPIGGGARDAILQDIGASVLGTSALSAASITPVGIIVPYLFSGVNPILTVGQGTGTFPYLLYMLFIQQATGCKVWFYDFADGSWMPQFLPNVQITARPQLSTLTTAAAPALSPYVLLVPYIDIRTGLPYIGSFDVTSFDDPIQDSLYTYRVEDVQVNRVPTVRRLVVTYRDLGPATVKFTVTGSNDSGALQSASQTVNIGNTVPTLALLTKFVDLQVTVFRPQLSVYRTAGGGPVSLVSVSMIGTSEDVTL